MTFSLLPDFLCARLRGDLDTAEAVCVAVESRGVEPAARDLRPEVGLPGVMRWIRRRTKGVRAALLALVTTMPEMVGSVAEVSAVRGALSTTRALVALREIGAAQLHALPCPLGFAPRPTSRKAGTRVAQHRTGPAPPTDATL